MENINWTQEHMLEVVLKEPDDFLKIRETFLVLVLLLEKKKNYINPVIYYINRVRYYIVHFKELFALDGKQTNLSENDIARRNRIATLLADWGLVELKVKLTQ